MRTRVVFALGMGLWTGASAAPVTLNHTGRLPDSNGAPIAGTPQLTFDLWADDARTNNVYTRVIQVIAEDGYYSVTLGVNGALDSQSIPSTGPWLEVSLGAQSLGLSPVGFVPLAAVAQRVEGGVANVMTSDAIPR